MPIKRPYYHALLLNLGYGLLKKDPMTPPDHSPITSEVIDRKRIRFITQAFLDIHAARLAAGWQSLSASHQEFLQALPILLHTNHPKLPGFVSLDTPCGFPKYMPSREDLDIIDRWANGPTYDKYLEHPQAFSALFLGSGFGSCTFHAGRPFTVWIIHDPIAPELYQNLLLKLELLTHFAAHRELTVIFELIDTATFQMQTDSLMPLKLDAFYAEAVFITGKTPVWWTVPPLFEDRYEEYVDLLLSHKFIDPESVFNIGGLPTLPQGSCISGSLFCLMDAIQEPYPSLLEYFFIETLIEGIQPIQPLSLRVKQAIYNKQDSMIVDVALLKFHIISDYLQQKSDPERLDFVKKCFYFSHTSSRAHLKSLTASWNLDPSYLKHLDKRAYWKIESAHQEAIGIIHEIATSYRRINTQAQRLLGSNPQSINQNALVLLGRKIYAVLEERPGKIDSINLGIAENLHEATLMIEEILLTDGESLWQIGRPPTDEKTPLSPFKQSTSLIELVAWAARNGLYNDTTKLKHSSLRRLFTKETVAFLFQVILEHTRRIPKWPDTRRLQKGSRLMQSLQIVNLLHDPFLAEPELLTIMDHDTDPLTFGHDRRCMITSIDQVLLNSWNEIFVQTFSGEKCILDWVRDFLLNVANPFKACNPTIEFTALAATKGDFLLSRLTQVARSLQEHFRVHIHAKTLRFLIPYLNGYLLCYFSNQSPVVLALQSQSQLIAKLEEPQKHYSPVIFDEPQKNNSLLAQLYSAHMGEQVNVYFLKSGDKTVLYVIDERGTLFLDRIPFFNLPSIVNHLSRFLNDTKKRNIENNYTIDLIPPKAADFYEIIQNPEGDRILVSRDELLEPLVTPTFAVQAIAVYDASKKIIYNVNIEGMNFSPLEDKDAYLKSAQYIVSKRPSKEKYPIRITNLDLSILEKDGNLPTASFLRAKKTIEDLLNFYLEKV